MDCVMSAQPAIPAKLKIETVKYMVKDAVENEPQKYARRDAQHMMRPQELRGHVPKTTKHGRHYEPGHRDQYFR